ncbi:hypothetical protein AB0K80_03820 [Streptomyces sp. NPDC052682]
MSKSTSRSPPDTIPWKSRAVRTAVADAAATDAQSPVTVAVLITETAV